MLTARDRILQTMRAAEPRRLFRTLQLAGSNGPLFALEEAGLIRSRERSGRGKSRYDWYVTDAQHAAIEPLPLADLIADTLDLAVKNRWPVVEYSAERIALDIGFDIMFKNVDREALVFRVREWQFKQKVAA